MDKSEFLQYRLLAREVKQIKNQLSALEASMYSPKGQRFTHTPRATCPKGNTMDDLVQIHSELETHYREQLAKREAQQLRIEQAIDSLEDTAERQVMRDRYINCYSWNRIGEEMTKKGYSIRQVYRIHGMALFKLREV